MPEGSTSVTLLAEDGHPLRISRECAQRIGALRPMLQLSKGDTTFPVAAVKSTTLAKAVEYLEHHKEDVPTLSLHLGKKQKDAKSKHDDMGDDSDSGAEDEDGSEERSHVLAASNQSSSSSGSEDNDEFLNEEYLANVSPWDQKFMDTLDLPALIELTKAANYLNISPLLDLCCRTIARQMTGLKTEELRRKFNLPNDFTPEEEAKLAAEFAWIEE